MDALLLSAGFGTRMAPLTDILPKCLMPIHGRALLSLWLETLVNAGITNIFVNIHAHADRVVKYIENSPYKDYVTILEEETLLGTAGTLKKFQSHFTHQDIFIAHADNLTFFDTKAFIDCHSKRSKNINCTLMSFISPTPETCGIISLDRNDHVVQFEEKPAKPATNLANGAVYIFDRESLFDLLSHTSDATDISHHILPQLINRMQAYLNNIYHRDIGNINSYNSAQKEIIELPEISRFIRQIPSYWRNSKNMAALRKQFIEKAQQAGMQSDVIAFIGKQE